MSTIPSFNTFMQRQVRDLQKAGKARTSETYRTTLNRLEEFLGGREVSFTEMTADLVDSFEEYLIGRNLSRNSTSFYTRIYLASVSNAGVDRANHRIINMLL